MRSPISFVNTPVPAKRSPTAAPVATPDARARAGLSPASREKDHARAPAPTRQVTPTASSVRFDSGRRVTVVWAALAVVSAPPALARATPASSSRLKCSSSHRRPPTTSRPRPALRTVATTGTGASAREAASATHATALSAIASSHNGRLASTASKRKPFRPVPLRIPSRFSSAAAPALSMPDMSASRLPMTSMASGGYSRGRGQVDRWRQ